MFGRKEAPPAGNKDLVEKRQHAAALIRNNRKVLQKPMGDMEWVGKHQYWWYGYRFGTAVTLMGSCLAVGDRLPFFRNYVSLIALAGGYYFGGFLHNMHIMYHKSQILTIIDNQLPEMERLDGKLAPQGVTEYGAEVGHLKHMRQQLAPDPDVLAKAAAESHKTIDERVDDLVASYEARRKV